MKKFFIAFAAVLFMAFTASAQNNLGLRLGGGQGYGVELSWQHGLGSNRLELDLGWHDGTYWSDINIVGVFQWTGEIGSGFGWYAGIGAGLTIVTWDNGHNGDGDFALGVVGQGGIEYKFDAIPLQLSIDIRPRVNFINPFGNDEGMFHWGDIALGVRYCF